MGCSDSRPALEEDGIGDEIGGARRPHDHPVVGAALFGFDGLAPAAFERCRRLDSTMDLSVAHDVYLQRRLGAGDIVDAKSKLGFHPADGFHGERLSAARGRRGGGTGFDSAIQ